MHKNSQKRIYMPGAAYFITTVTRGRWPYFEDEILRRFFADHVEFTRDITGCHVCAYAIMPDHVHIMLWPTEVFNYSRIMFSLKKQFSHNANRVMGYVDFNGGNAMSEGANVCPEGAQTFARLRSVILSRMNMHREKFIITHNGKCPHPLFRWQKSFHDHVIRDDMDFRNHVHYIQRQPEHHGAPGGVWVDGEMCGNAKWT